MAPLAVDPAALDSAGGAAVAAGAGLGAVISSLTAALAGCAGMAGDATISAATATTAAIAATTMAGQLRVRGMGKGAGAVTPQMVSADRLFAACTRPHQPGHAAADALRHR